MSERVDHVAKAEEWLAHAEGVGLTWEETTGLTGIAQVRATLALVEQQRIANLIALEDQRWARVAAVGNYFGPDVLRGNPENPGDNSPLRPEIAKALGLE